ncbi:MAG: KGG domain-containing protein [Chitinophagaceae bacterium]
MQENRNENESKKLNRGFAAMDPAQRKLIAREGGRAAHKQGVAHKWTTEEAREAGRKGGQISRSKGPRNPTAGTEGARNN